MFSTDPFALIVVLVGMSLLPFVAMIATSYLKIVVVMSLIRNALGVQSIPPNMVINALAMILTFYVMAPVIGESWDILKRDVAENRVSAKPTDGVVKGTVAQKVCETESFVKASEPFRTFLKKHTDEKQLAFFVRTAERLWAVPDEKGDPQPATVDRNSFYVLVPAFCVTELTRAFQIGFLVYLPFIAIDIIVSNILLAMGMMMVSPVTISLPFKLLLFVMVNGWTLLIQGLVRSYLH